MKQLTNRSYQEEYLLFFEDNRLFQYFTPLAIIITSFILLGIPFLINQFDSMSYIGIAILFAMIVLSMVSIFKKKQSKEPHFLICNPFLILGFIIGGLLILFSVLGTNTI